MGFFIAAQAGPLTTLQNSPLSVPAAAIAAGGVPGATNLTGSNFLMSAVSPVSAEGGQVSLVNTQQWAVRYNAGPSSYENAGNALVIRADGSVVVTGNSIGTGTGYDFATVCYSPNGTALWTNRYDGPNHGDDNAQFLATTGNGDIFLAGESLRYATNDEISDVALIRYASNGVPLWTNRYTASDPIGVYPNALAVDGSGNAYIIMSLVYWNSSETGTSVETDLVKYDPLGNVLWIWTYPASAMDNGFGLYEPAAIALDTNGNLFVAGQSGGQYNDTGISIVKCTADGTPLWTNNQPFSPWDVKLLSIDHQGNVIVTGESYKRPSEVYQVLKFSSDGICLWTNSMAGPGYDGGNVPEVVSDLAGNVILIGGSSGEPSGSYHILKCDPNGVPLWTNQQAYFGITNSIIVNSTVDNAGNLYVTGNAPAMTTGYPNFVTMKYSSGGQLIWSNRYDGPALLGSYPSAISVDGSGGVYVTGSSSRPYSPPGFLSDNSDLTTVKYADQLFYTPPKNFTGLDAITYTLTDAQGNSATNSLLLVVTPGDFQFNLSKAASRFTLGGLQLQVTGMPGTNAVVIDASSDLVNWTSILTNLPVSGSVSFLDPASTNFQQRYYRAHQQQ